jgi:glutamyl-tRNA synthetase
LRDAHGRKLSKRSGDTSIAFYRAQGYVPEAFRNFLTRIVWVHPEDKDVYPFEDFIEGMRVEDLPKTGPFANPALLDFISGEWLRTYDPSTLFDTVAGWLRWLLEEYTPDGVSFDVIRKQERIPHPVSREELEAFQQAFLADRAYSERVLSLEPERYHTLGDIVLQTPLYFRSLFRPASVEMLSDAARGDTALAAEILHEFLAWYTGEESLEEWEAKMDAMWRSRGLRRGVPFMLLRVAITGSKQTPPLHDVIGLLGPAEVQGRVAEALSVLERRGLDHPSNM